MCACASTGVHGILPDDVGVPYLIGHSWVTRLKSCGILPYEIEFIDLPGGTFESVGDKLRRTEVRQDAGYVFVLLGGNDIDNVPDTLAVNSVKDSCSNFAALVRLKFPKSRIIFFQVEDRFMRGSLQENVDFKRKSNKFNKWLNTFGGKDKLFCLKGKEFFSLPFWYSHDGVHLNEAGYIKLASMILNYIIGKMADC